MTAHSKIREAQRTNRIHPGQIKSFTDAGRYADGGGLYLFVRPGGSASWVFRYSNANKGGRVAGGNKVSEIGLGSAQSVSLVRARKLREQFRDLIAAGKDPVLEKKKTRQIAAAQSENLFGPFADKFLEDLLAKFKNEKHRQQWKTTFEVHCAPIRNKSISEIVVADIEALLAPLWKSVPETAGRIRGRIERVFSRAIARGLYDKVNPAGLKIHQAILGTPIAKLKKTRSHPAIPYADMPAFMQKLRALNSISALALEFLILTNARTSEVLLGTTEEMDRDQKLWTVPAERMKAEKAHTVPLAPRALKILATMDRLRDDDTELLFPNDDTNESLCKDALRQCLKGLAGYKEFTVHGCRSTFDDWANDCTTFDADTIEFSLAHGVKNKTRRAYRRTTSVEKRRALLLAWENYLAGR